MKRIWIYVSQRCVPEHCIHAGRKLYGRSRKSAGECRSINNIDTQPSLFISSFSPGAVVPVLVVDLARANPREGGSQRRQIPTELPTEKNENTQPPPSLFFSLPQLHDLLHRIHRQRLWPRLPCLLLANSRQTSASPSPLLLSLCSVQPYHFTLSSPLHIPVLYSLSGLLRVLGTCHCSFLSYYSFFFFHLVIYRVLHWLPGPSWLQWAYWPAYYGILLVEFKSTPEPGPVKDTGGLWQGCLAN